LLSPKLRPLSHRAKKILDDKSRKIKVGAKVRHNLGIIQLLNWKIDDLLN